MDDQQPYDGHPYFAADNGGMDLTPDGDFAGFAGEFGASIAAKMGLTPNGYPLNPGLLSGVKCPSPYAAVRIGLDDGLDDIRALGRAFSHQMVLESEYNRARWDSIWRAEC